MLLEENDVDLLLTDLTTFVTPEITPSGSEENIPPEIAQSSPVSAIFND